MCRVGDNVIVARLPETANSRPVKDPDPSPDTSIGRPGSRSTATSRVENSPWTLSLDTARLWAIASRSVADQFAVIDPQRWPPCKLWEHHSRTSGLTNCGHRRTRSAVALGLM